LISPGRNQVSPMCTQPALQSTPSSTIPITLQQQLLPHTINTQPMLIGITTRFPLHCPSLTPSQILPTHDHHLGMVPLRLPWVCQRCLVPRSVVDI
ncbi:hypothetical protein FRC03_005857, partial [Tulasnella sp. 419]